MAEQFDIHLIWVPGHRDIPGNCKADELARLGTTLHAPGELEHVGMTVATCKLLLRNSALTATNGRWSLVGKCVHSKLMWPCLNWKRTNALLSLSRPDVSLIVSVMTGHCLIGRHAERLKVLSNDFCRSCGDEEEVESIEHLLCLCPALSRRRRATLGSYFFVELANLADVGIRQLLSFFGSTGGTRKTHYFLSIPVVSQWTI